jgi:hypothetical protein
MVEPVRSRAVTLAALARLYGESLDWLVFRED